MAAAGVSSTGCEKLSDRCSLICPDLYDRGRISSSPEEFKIFFIIINFYDRCTRCLAYMNPYARHMVYCSILGGFFSYIISIFLHFLLIARVPTYYLFILLILMTTPFGWNINFPLMSFLYSHLLEIGLALTAILFSLHEQSTAMIVTNASFNLIITVYG
ncbi:hypothetical protein ZIOFF_042980 [Zingiber officinale]|uniref:Uncharacterized protein n=1 Tax=Zingiber officinale TaxID=94328 RepID=A0A8J5KPB9_ZINOF|nr:hypothetical protein ZIOFF_042980 [Zingiber officinale]